MKQRRPTIVGPIWRMTPRIRRSLRDRTAGVSAATRAGRRRGHQRRREFWDEPKSRLHDPSCERVLGRVLDACGSAGDFWNGMMRGMGSGESKRDDTLLINGFWVIQEFSEGACHVTTVFSARSLDLRHLGGSATKISKLEEDGEHLPELKKPRSTPINESRKREREHHQKAEQATQMWRCPVARPVWIKFGRKTKTDRCGRKEGWKIRKKEEGDDRL